MNTDQSGDPNEVAERPEVGTTPKATLSGPTPAYSWYVVGLTTVIYMFAQIDRKLPLILIESIRKDLHLSDTQIGIATGIAFTLIYSVASIWLSRLADHYGRKFVIIGSLVVWSAITALNGVAANFWQFTLARVGVAVGEAGCTPASFAIIADYFPTRRHAIALSILMTAAPIGSFLSLYVGGSLNDLVHWRYTMMLIAIPSFLLALIAALTMKEPKYFKGPKRDVPPPFFIALRHLAGIATYRQIILAAAITGLTASAVSNFAPAYVLRHFGFSTTQTGASYGPLAAIAGITSGIVGGLIVQRLQNWDSRAGLWYVFAVNLLAAPSAVLALFCENYVLFLFFMFLPEASIIAYAGPAGSAIMALVDKRMRALASAILMFAFMGIAGSIGPILAGVISDALRPSLHEDSLKWALIALTPFRIWGAFHYLLAARAYRGDLRALKRGQ